VLLARPGDQRSPAGCVIRRADRPRPLQLSWPGPAFHRRGQGRAHGLASGPAPPCSRADGQAAAAPDLPPLAAISYGGEMLTAKVRRRRSASGVGSAAVDVRRLAAKQKNVTYLYRCCSDDTLWHPSLTTDHPSPDKSPRHAEYETEDNCKGNKVHSRKFHCDSSCVSTLGKEKRRWSERDARPALSNPGPRTNAGHDRSLAFYLADDETATVPGEGRAATGPQPRFQSAGYPGPPRPFIDAARVGRMASPPGQRRLAAILHGGEMLTASVSGGRGHQIHPPYLLPRPSRGQRRRQAG